MKRRFRSLVLTPQLYAELIQSSERKRLEGSAGEVDALAENRVGGVNEQQRRGASAAGTNRVGPGNLGQARIKAELIWSMLSSRTKGNGGLGWSPRLTDS